MSIKTFLFVDNASGEEFAVQASSKIQAFDIARDNFEKPKCLGIFDDEYVEMLGIDTY